MNYLEQIKKIANTLKNNDQTISLKIKDTNSKPTQTFFDYSLVNEESEKYSNE